ncbi:hypothetical protein GCM10025854_16160 [Tetragenococcus muriaticus]|nr:hypothetical protein GCM10025854_02870 [Tetragenococcus muriaticus]GMA47366.1 hypothetical protein GCM10025854_16160 [Tetragenococcus muriaticus]
MKIYSAEKEEYLKLIDKNQAEEGTVRNHKLAEQLGIANSSVTEMFLKMSQKGLIVYKPYKGVKLTEEGAAHIFYGKPKK